VPGRSLFGAESTVSAAPSPHLAGEVQISTAAQQLSHKLNITIASSREQPLV